MPRFLLAVALAIFVTPVFADPPAAIVTPSIKSLNENLIPAATPAPPSNSWPLHKEKAIVIAQLPDHVWNVVQPTLNTNKQVFPVVEVTFVPAKTPIFASLEGDKVSKSRTYAQDTLVIFATGAWPDDKTLPEEAAKTSFLVVLQKLKIDKTTAVLVDQQVVEVFAPGNPATPPKPVTPGTPVTPGGPPVTPGTPASAADPALVKAFGEALAKDMASTSNGVPLGSKADAAKLATVYATTAAWLGGGTDPTAPKPQIWKDLIDDLTAASVKAEVPRLPSLTNLREAVSKVVPARAQTTALTPELTATTLAQFKSVALALMEVSK